MRALYKILAALLAIFVLWNAYVFLFRHRETELATYGFVEDSFTAEGVLIKKETLISAKTSGIIKAYYDEGQKIGKGKKIVSVVEQGFDEQAQSELASVNERISEIKTSGIFAEDLLSIDEQIKKINQEIVFLTAEGKMGQVAKLYDSLMVLIDKKAAVKGENSGALLKSLTERKEELERQMGGVGHDMYAPCSGIYSAQIDGLEEKLSTDNIEKLRVSDVENTSPEIKTLTEVNTGDTVCKIIDNYEWYIAFTCDAKAAEDIKEGNSVTLEFSESPSTFVSAQIKHISEKENGKCVVTVKPQREIDGILKKRHVTLKVIKKRYEGLKLPISTLSVNNEGETGVLVDRDGEEIFKKARIIYKDDEWVIFGEDNSVGNALLLYDNVLLKGNGGF